MSSQAASSAPLGRRELLAALLSACAGACRGPITKTNATIEFTKLPPAEGGDSDKVYSIEGRVAGAKPGQQVILFAKSGVWWVQPFANHPFTTIGPGSKWANSTHPGTAYAALLVDASYKPPLTARFLPSQDPSVLATAVTDGVVVPVSPRKTLNFGGYDWQVQQVTYSPGGTRNYYESNNVWVDKSECLHLRIGRVNDRWTSAQLSLAEGLGYGSYRFTIRDISFFEPSAVLTVSLVDNSAPSHEIDIEISRWGEQETKNAQYVMQPYYVAENSVRFLAPAGVLTHLIDWTSERVLFETVRGYASGSNHNVVASHTFTSGIPAPDNDRITLNLYVFGSARYPLQHECEVVVEKFEFLP